MPKMPQPSKKPGTPLPEKLRAATEASDTPERKAAARKYLDAERAAHQAVLKEPLREDLGDKD